MQHRAQPLAFLWGSLISLWFLNVVVLATDLITITSLSMSKHNNTIPRAADRIRLEPESVWIEFNQLASEEKPLNLGQGFPDFAAPKWLIDSLHEATNYNNSNTVLNNQYTRSFGHPRLVKALTRYYKDFRSFNRLIDQDKQVLVTVGAYEALFTSIMAFVNPGDEVIIIDPAFDAYAPIVKMAQGKSVFVPLRLKQQNGQQQSTGNISSADFALDMNEFESKISNRTKMLILNTPNNPLGKIFNRSELESIASLCIKHNILVLADEVYEQMFYSPEEHLSIASLPGMWERTITVGSAGKTFSVTGWKIGWAFGPMHLIEFARLVHQTAVYTVATPLQEAIARALEHEMEVISGGPSVAGASYWHKLRTDLVAWRDRMAGILERAQMRPVVPQGGYFMLADFSTLARQFPEYEQEGLSYTFWGANISTARMPDTNDYRFARWLSRSKKLQGIPASVFYSRPHKPLAENMIRFCFIKQDSTLDKLEALIGNLTPANG